MKNFTDYEQEFSLSFLVNMTFGVKLSNRDDYGITSGYTKMFAILENVLMITKLILLLLIVLKLVLII